MKCVVVYESVWGNTAAVARAVAEGLGAGTRALSTAEATADLLEGADLLVAGAPVFGFKLSTEKMRDSIRDNWSSGATPPDLSHPSLRAWLAALPPGHGKGAAFDTQVKGPFGKGAPEVAKLLRSAGYESLGEPTGFVVRGKHGPLKDGELERARAWGAELAALSHSERRLLTRPGSHRAAPVVRPARARRPDPD